jgi:hypothetical protein
MAKRPILAIAPINGDLAEILQQTNAGTVIDFEDKANLKKNILTLYQQFKANELQIDSKNIAQFHRKELTKKLADIINSIC